MVEVQVPVQAQVPMQTQPLTQAPLRDTHQVVPRIGVSSWPQPSTKAGLGGPRGLGGPQGKEDVSRSIVARNHMTRMTVPSLN